MIKQKKMLTNRYIYDKIILAIASGPLAQLVRATGSKPVGLGFESLKAHQIFPYHSRGICRSAKYAVRRFKYRGIAQLVESRSPKPLVVGSSPTAPAKKKARKALILQGFPCLFVLPEADFRRVRFSFFILHYTRFIP